MVDIEPGMYSIRKDITFMNGTKNYYEIKRDRHIYLTCRNTTHKDFMYLWAYIGPSEVCRW
jgi:hypothetical protein